MKTRRQNLHSETTVFQRGSVTCQLTVQTYIHTLLGLQMILFNRAQRNTTSNSCKELYYGSNSEPNTIEFNNNSMRKKVICFSCKKWDDFLDNKFWISSNVHPHQAHTPTKSVACISGGVNCKGCLIGQFLLCHS